ncbi:MAG: ImmA/IrrE family metallo-endopeptidase [Anaerolineae bacterium]
MIKPITEKELVRHAVELAARTRREIEAAGLLITDFEQVASLFDVTVVWGELPAGKDGSYLKDERKIVLSTSVTTPERINFSFCHEIMHARIEDDGDLLSDFADAYRRSDEEAMERLCNAGAAELLMPAENIRQIMLEKGFSTSLIPELCEHFQASSLAVAFQMVDRAQHECHLVIAEPRMKTASQAPELVIIYTARSSSVEKYSIKRWQTLPQRSLLYDALRLVDGNSSRGEDCLPFATGTEWIVPCEALYFRGKVFAFFNVSAPTSSAQLALF